MEQCWLQVQQKGRLLRSHRGPAARAWNRHAVQVCGPATGQLPRCGPALMRGGECASDSRKAPPSSASATTTPARLASKSFLCAHCSCLVRYNASHSYRVWAAVSRFTIFRPACIFYKIEYGCILIKALIKTVDGNKKDLFHLKGSGTRDGTAPAAAAVNVEHADNCTQHVDARRCQRHLAAPRRQLVKDGKARWLLKAWAPEWLPGKPFTNADTPTSPCRAHWLPACMCFCTHAYKLAKRHHTTLDHVCRVSCRARTSRAVRLSWMPASSRMTGVKYMTVLMPATCCSTCRPTPAQADGQPC